MGLARWLRRAWWIPASAVFVALFAAYSFVTPYLVPGLKDPPRWVARAADRLEPVEGVDGHVPVRVMPVREYTDQPNAFAAGLGSSRRVVLFDTLLHEFPRPQVTVALAHEIGHQARQHIAKQIGWFALITLPMALIVALVARRRGGMAVPEAVPLVILLVVVLNLLTAPLQATVSRRYEAEADWAALQATHDPGAMEKLFQGFTRIGRSDPDPPGWWQALFESHPSALQRIEMANAWALRERR
jgi:Zn-dependent protease with chaperone function